MPVLDEKLDQMTSDEPGGSGDKHFHEGAPLEIVDLLSVD
jgi:hypothetical protein